MTENYDLAVAYRIYPRVSKTPVVLGNNKYKLAELCLRSFRSSLGTLRAKMWVLLDNCPKEYEDLFKRYFDTKDLELIPLKKSGNLATFGMQLDILLKQDASETVYFAEDDYYYLPDQFSDMIRFLKAHPDVHFVSPYDHPDYYTLDLHNHRNLIRAFENRHWRTANSSCMTFLTTKRTLEKTRGIFRSFTRNNFDASLWLSLTKHKLFNPVTPLKYLMTNELLFKIIVKAWLYGWRQILFGRRWRLWVPIPTIATTVESTALAPAINWVVLLNEAIHEHNLDYGG